MSYRADRSEENASGDVPIGVLTVSDRAYAGVYEDQGGPGIIAVLSDYLTTKWRPVARIVRDDKSEIEASVRIGIGRMTTEDDINYTADYIIKTVQNLL